MKKSKAIIAITTLAILATTVAVVSCKKDNGNTLNQKGYTIRQPADIRQMEDPRTYMLDFKKKLTESKDNEAFSLDDAAWHLACLANLDFCNVNVKYDDFQFDTVEMQVNVSDGIILLSDLRSAYEQMCAEIQQFKKGFNRYDQNMYYINVSINTDGNAKIALMTSFTTDSKDFANHTWYFSDAFAGLTVCYQYYSDDSIYIWNDKAVSELARVLNIFEHHDYEIPLPGGLIQIVYFPTRNHSFDYTNTAEDPYGSDFYHNSRVFVLKGSIDLINHILDVYEMCTCVDSYAALAYDYIDDNLYTYEHPVNWNVIAHTVYDPYNHQLVTIYHELYVEYGRLITPNPPGPEPN